MTKEEKIKVLQDWDGYFCGHSSDEVTEVLNEAIELFSAEPCINIPKDATNYDMMEAVFGHEVAIDLLNELSMGKSWWNAPYKRGGKE